MENRNGEVTALVVGMTIGSATVKRSNRPQKKLKMKPHYKPEII